jgi:hypothetical protein
VYSDLVGELETVAHMLDDPVTAVSVLGACSRLREDVGRPLPPNERAREEERTAALRAALGQEAFERAWREGRAFTPEAAVQLALERSAEEPVAPALRSGGQFS